MSTVNDDAIYCEVSNDIFEMKENKCYSDVKISTPSENEPTSKTKKSSSTRRCVIFIFVVIAFIVLVLVATCACVVFALVEIARFKKEDARFSTFQAESPFENITASLDYCIQELAELRQSFYSSGVQELIAEHNRNTTEELTELRQNFSQFQYDLQQLYCPSNISSCSRLPSSCPSGYYWASFGRVYCNMTLSCGGVTGGWMRVAELNMTDTRQQCPGGLVENNEAGIRHCRIQGNSCVAQYFLGRQFYSSVCGRITAYQVGSTNAFRRYYQNSANTVHSHYVDGISLTHGNYFYQNLGHIWTFAAALDKQHDNMDSKCPCLFDRGLPPFVGEDYFCDAGNEEFMTGESGLQTDPLWDGTDCLCCDNPPWFYKQLPQPTTDAIRMMVCNDGNDENIAITEIEIYVR